MMASIAYVTAVLAMLGCMMAGGLGFLVGLRDAGKRTGTIGGMLLAITIGGVFSAIVWGWVWFATSNLST
jgi:hypothetical protein